MSDCNPCLFGTILTRNSTISVSCFVTPCLFFRYSFYSKLLLVTLFPLGCIAFVVLIFVGKYYVFTRERMKDNSKSIQEVL